MTTPGALFADLWERVAPSTGPIIETPWEGRAAPELRAIAALMMRAASEDVPDEIGLYLAGEATPFACAVADLDQRAFVVMCALDDAAMYIHPAMPTRLPGRATSLPIMLQAMKAERTAYGCYANKAGVGMVVPKGHLMSRKRPHDATEASGTDLAHHFEYLSLIGPLAHGRTMRFVVPPPHRCDIPPTRAEHVGLAPIAEDRDDLGFVTKARGTTPHPYLDTVPVHPLLSDRIGQTVGAMLDEGAGLVVLPELVTLPAGVEALRAILSARPPGATPALILAGTGPSKDISPSGLPYNETALMTADGRVLYRQRKLHLFRMAFARMAECGIPRQTGHDHDNHLEDAAAGQELVICDLFGLGRVVVLICEDLQQQTPGGDVALIARPDWILTPVLDVSQTAGRWPHARAIEIGRKTGSRVVVSCSATLGVRAAGKDKLVDVTADPVKTGICFDGFEDQKVLIVESPGGAAASYRVIEWKSHAWPRHKTVLPPPASAPP